MSDETTRAVLARLAAQEADLAALRAEVAARRPARRACSRRPRLVAALLLALALASVPLGLAASDRFADVPASNPYHDDINAVAAAGIVGACNPPADDKFCPSSKVARDELAGALARAAGLGGHPPVANAARASYAASAGTAQAAASAANAAALQGYAADGLVRVAAGRGEVEFAHAVETTVATVSLTAPAAGFVLVTATGLVAPLGGGCPCDGIATVYDDTGASNSYAFRLLSDQVVVADIATLANGWVFPVDAGARTFSLRVAVFSAAPPPQLFAKGAVTALYVPFGADGAGPPRRRP